MANSLAQMISIIYYCDKRHKDKKKKEKKGTICMLPYKVITELNASKLWPYGLYSNPDSYLNIFKKISMDGCTN